jgi:hypothetical protein
MRTSKKGANESKNQAALPGTSATTRRMEAISRDQGPDKHHPGSMFPRAVIAG